MDTEMEMDVKLIQLNWLIDMKKKASVSEMLKLWVLTK